MWNTIKEIAAEFVNNTGLSIVRAIAFFILGLIVVKLVRIILRSALYKSKLDGAAATFVISIITIVLYTRSGSSPALSAAWTASRCSSSH